MKSRERLLTPLLLLLALPAAAQARTLALDEPAARPWSEAALRIAAGQAARLGARSPVLRVSDLRELPGGVVIRLQQEHRGLAVMGAEAVLHLRCAGRARSCRAVALTGELAALDGSAGPPLAGLLDRAAAERALRRSMPDARLQRAELAFWPGPPRAEPVWRIHLRRARPFQLVEVLLSARTGERLWQRPTLREANGTVYPISAAMSKVEEKPLLGLTSTTQLQGENASVSSCQLENETLSCQTLAKPDAGGNYLFDPQEPSFIDPFAEVQAYFHADKIHRWMSKQFGFTRKSGKPIKVHVNFGFEYSGQLSGYPNAFYGDVDDDTLGDLTFGQGKRDYSYDGDVIYHEFNHSVVAETSRLEVDLDSLGLNMMPAALDEGFADMMSCSHNNDPVLGEYVSGNSSSGLRDLRGAGSCPDQLTGESHLDGLVWARALWALREQATAKPLFETLVYQTMIGLSTKAGIADASALLLSLLKNADPSLHAGASSLLAARGLLECSRLVPLPSGKLMKGELMSTSTFGVKPMPGPFQYRVEVPARAIELRVKILPQHGATGPIVYYRAAEPVAYASGQVTKDGEGSSSDEIVFTPRDTARPLVPGTPYYFLPLNWSQREIGYTIEATLTEAPPPEAGPPDAGIDAEPARVDRARRADAVGLEAGPSTTSGCSVGLVPRRAAWPLAGLLLLMIALRRRRR